MKKIGFVAIVLAGLFFSCKKDSATNPQPVVGRKIHFELFTNKDFTTDNNLITFTLKIVSPDKLISWDSVLPPMKIKDIPSEFNKIEVEKQVPNDDGKKILTTGFLYYIQDVGTSWYLDTCGANETFKRVRFNFQ